MSTKARWISAAGLLLVGFAWGAAAWRYDLFPVSTARAAWGRVRSLLQGEDAVARAILWHRAPEHGRAPDREALAALANLPYLRGTKSAPTVDKVTIYDPSRARNGINLVVSGHAPEATLVDMRGNILHRWRCAFEDVWSEPLPFKEWAVHRTFWRRAHVYPNGDLLAIFEGVGMIKLDRDSSLLWALQERCHHDLDIDDHGNIWTLARVDRAEHPRYPSEKPIREDFVLVISPDGEELRRISILEALLDSKYAPLLAGGNRFGDILHTNTIELMDGRFASRHPLYAKGNVLLSLPTLNTIAVLDPRTEQIIWALGGLWVFQHQPTVLDNGRMLVFDNVGDHGLSKVVEIDPVTQEIFWVFRSTPERRFSSAVIGSCQRLANGNTLITETTSGRAFEVTRDHDIVWELVNPNRAGKDDELIASLMEVVRIPRDYFAPSFEAVQNEYATGERTFDPSAVLALLEELRRGK